jgi:hypothetical protein
METCRKAQQAFIKFRSVCISYNINFLFPCALSTQLRCFALQRSTFPSPTRAHTHTHTHTHTAKVHSVTMSTNTLWSPHVRTHTHTHTDSTVPLLYLWNHSSVVLITPGQGVGIGWWEGVNGWHSRMSTDLMSLSLIVFCLEERWWRLVWKRGWFGATRLYPWNSMHTERL